MGTDAKDIVATTKKQFFSRGAMTFSITTLGITTFSILTLGIKGVCVTLSKTML